MAIKNSEDTVRKLGGNIPYDVCILERLNNVHLNNNPKKKEKKKR
jgi:hypothetical protein